MQQRILGVFTLGMINVAAIISLRNLPIMAQYGYAAIFFYVLAGLLYLIPTGLVCAELATGWPKRGGIYLWVSEAFGKKYGFLTIWFSWMESIAWFPAVISFIAITLAYIFNPALAQNKIFMVSVILVVFWGATLLNFLGMRTSSWVSTIGVILGTLLPGALIIGLGLWWRFSGKITQVHYSFDNLIPDLHLNNLVFFSGVLLGFAGMELAAFHAQEAKNPQHDYPKAMLLATITILIISILGSWAISLVVPSTEIGLVEGIMQAFSYFFNEVKLGWIVPIIAVMAVIGPCAGINTWIIGPVKGMLPAAKDGFLPKIFQIESKDGVPISLLVFQAMIGSSLALVFLFTPNVNTAYWTVTAISAQFTLIMYSTVFAAAIRLRYTQPEVKRTYKVPGGNWGIWLVAGTGIITCIFSFMLTFIPPEALHVHELIKYEAWLVIWFVCLASPPFILAKLKQPHWQSVANEIQQT